MEYQWDSMSKSSTFAKNILKFKSSLDFVFLKDEEMEDILEQEAVRHDGFIIATALDEISGDLVCCRGDGSLLLLAISLITKSNSKNIKPIDYGLAVAFGNEFIATDTILMHQEARIFNPDA